MANENPSRGQERIANELLLKLGIQMSPRTVRKYLPPRPRGRPQRDLRWSTFLRLHAQGIIACDFLVAVTAHPTAGWTLHQRRETVGFESNLRPILKSYIAHYNAGRPHMALGPGGPDPPPTCRNYQRPNSRHRREESYAVRANFILGGLHHEYFLAPARA